MADPAARISCRRHAVFRLIVWRDLETPPASLAVLAPWQAIETRDACRASMTADVQYFENRDWDMQCHCENQRNCFRLAQAERVVAGAVERD